MTHVTTPAIYTHMRAWEGNRDWRRYVSSRHRLRWRPCEQKYRHEGKRRKQTGEASPPNPEVSLLTRPKFRRVPTVEELPRLFDNEFVAQLELPRDADRMRLRAG